MVAPLGAMMRRGQPPSGGVESTGASARMATPWAGAPAGFAVGFAVESAGVCEKATPNGVASDINNPSTASKRTARVSIGITESPQCRAVARHPNALCQGAWTTRLEGEALYQRSRDARLSRIPPPILEVHDALRIGNVDPPAE